MNSPSVALFDSAIQYGALGLVGVVIVVGCGIGLTMTRAMLRTFADHRDAMRALTQQVNADTRALERRIDVGERALQANVDSTRQALREIVKEEHGETRQHAESGLKSVAVELRRLTG